MLTYDSTIFSVRDEDIIYLKYIKSLKNYFCDLLMLKDFDYGGEPATNHFFRDYLAEYVKYVSDEHGNIISYDSYLSKIEKSHKGIDQVIQYISEIEDKSGNINHSVMMGFHLMLMVFLNRYGHDYQRTVPQKIRHPDRRQVLYRSRNKEGFIGYLQRCKIANDFKAVIAELRANRKPANTNSMSQIKRAI